MRLYVLPGACSLASHIALEAAADAQGSKQAGPRSGLDVVVVQRGCHRKPDYLAVNPRGTVPALVTREGNLIVESLAVLLHIADQVPAAGLAPPLGDPARDRLHGLLSFMVTTVHPAFQMLWRAERFADSEEARADVRRTAEGRIATLLGTLEEELNSRGRLIGDGFSVADAYLFVLGRWGLRLDRPTTAHRRLWKFTEATAALPAARRAMEREGISLTEPKSGLG